MQSLAVVAVVATFFKPRLVPISTPFKLNKKVKSYQTKRRIENIKLGTDHYKAKSIKACLDLL